jgi:hypothetical protein
MNINEILSESAYNTVIAHYKRDAGNFVNIFYNTDTSKVHFENQSGVQVSPSNLMFRQRGSNYELSDLLVGGIRVSEPETDQELADEVGTITGLENYIRPGKATD